VADVDGNVLNGLSDVTDSIQYAFMRWLHFALQMYHLINSCLLYKRHTGQRQWWKRQRSCDVHGERESPAYSGSPRVEPQYVVRGQGERSPLKLVAF